MAKKISITFEYDPDTDTIKNLKCDAEGLVKKTRAKKEPIQEEDEDADPLVTLEENKLIINKKAQEEMGINVGDRVLIIWNKVGKLLLPFIGTDEMFEQDGGNKLTKAGTVSYRGAQNVVLAEYGTEFTIKLEGGKWRLVPLNPVIKEETEADKNFENYEPIEVTDGDDNYEIDSENFKFNL